MQKIRYYYSPSLKIVNQEVIISEGKQALATGRVLGRTKNFPRVTICGYYDPEKEIMLFGVARCSGKDNFVKAKGRKLTYNRALTSPYRITCVSKKAKISDIFIKNCREIEDEVLSMSYPVLIK